MHFYTSIQNIRLIRTTPSTQLVDRIQVPFQIEDDPIHWLIGVKCRKITHGYCTLKIVHRDYKMGNCTNGTKCTRQHGHHKPANSNSNPLYMCLLMASLFMRALKCMRHCATQSNSSSIRLFNAGSPHTNVICAQQQGVLMEMHGSSKIHKQTSSIFIS